MTEERIPLNQAVNLVAYMKAFGEVGAIMQAAEQRMNQLREPLVGFAKIANIPLDQVGLVVHIDKGPDKKGLILVEWKDNGKANTP